MQLTEIKKIEEILQIDKPLIKHKISSLSTVPENGGSFLLNIDLRLKNHKNFEEKLEVVAKLAAINGHGRAKTFQNELIFYRDILPLVDDFLKLQEVPYIFLFPIYYGGRLTLNSRSKEVDKDAIFFLENLKNSGYKTLEPNIGYNLETTNIILKELARFHAIFLAIKIKKPEIFKHKVKPFVNKTEISVNTDDIKKVVSLMWRNERCVSLIPRLRKAMVQNELPPREPISTIIHNNLWTQNIMVKLNGNRKDVIKLVDFQHYGYGSPTADILFFLFTSVEISILEDHLDELFRSYHDHFVSELSSFEINDPLFSLENFLKDVATEATNGQFPHIIMKLDKILSAKYAKEHEERVWYTVLEFAKRNWI